MEAAWLTSVLDLINSTSSATAGGIVSPDFKIQYDFSGQTKNLSKYFQRFPNFPKTNRNRT